mmetsp:Transcript_33024/g.36968  ORF Transcript_33024/g.36968 Transcript_33024/m.36968 type:complete len:133 (+) Transcript_33024:77-475(+)|eukprot:CAMPEP_0170792806 /NCGR_PEP_ID=MMETSP0733-20121128/22188_1 /TAXON_ID=186038 /ORGANISM="Fragilariopsis kerguelensis, Strain L26-C5" /LENGTH=132 /DNA_ID=CAMNT_0011141455 /DNA_START=28 /DNA_END=426 /DNA_ORIENTATION=-
MNKQSKNQSQSDEKQPLLVVCDGEVLSDQHEWKKKALVVISLLSLLVIVVLCVSGRRTSFSTDVVTAGDGMMTVLLPSTHDISCAKTCALRPSCIYNKFDGTNNCCDQKAVCASVGSSMVCSLSGGWDCASV